MKKFAAALLASLALCVSGCTSKTDFGPCIGAFDDKDPSLIYKANGWNIAMGVVFVELIVPPIIVIVDETLCPIGHAPKEAK